MRQASFPPEWKIATLDDRQCFERIGGRTPPTGRTEYWEDGSIPWISGEDVQEGRINIVSTTKKKITSLAVKDSVAAIIPKNSVILSCTATIGKVAINMQDMTSNQQFNAFVIKKDFKQKFLAYYFLSARDELLSLSRSTTFPHITIPNLSRLSIPKPDILTQENIISRLDYILAKLGAKYESLIELYHRRLALLQGSKVTRRLGEESFMFKQIRSAILTSALSGNLTDDKEPTRNLSDAEVVSPDLSETKSDELGIIPTNWHWTKAEAVIIDARYGTSVKCSKEIPGIPVLRIPNIVSGSLAFSNIVYAKLEREKVRKLIMEEGDLLVCRTNGSLNLVGKAAIFPKVKQDFIFASYLIRLRPNKSLVLAEYLNLVLESLLARKIIENRARTTAGQYNVNLETLRSIPIPLAPISEQKQIVKMINHKMVGLHQVVQSINAVNSYHHESMKYIESLSMSILKLAFKGKIA